MVCATQMMMIIIIIIIIIISFIIKWHLAGTESK
jgi:hypothetical protein